MSEMSHEQELDDFQAAVDIGQKVIEMADRLEPVDRVTPGAQATWKFSIEDIEYSVVLTVVSRDAGSKADPA